MYDTLDHWDFKLVSIIDYCTLNFFSLIYNHWSNQNTGESLNVKKIRHLCKQ